MTWLSVNPRLEPEIIIDAAMAISGDFPSGWHESGEYMIDVPEPKSLHPNHIAALYNNADSLGLDIYRIGNKDK